MGFLALRPLEIPPVAPPNPPFSWRAPFRLPQKKLPIAVATLRPSLAPRITHPFPFLRLLSPVRLSPVVDIVRNPPRTPRAIRSAINPTSTLRSSRCPSAPIRHRIVPARHPPKIKRASGPPASVVNNATHPPVAIKVAGRPDVAPSTHRTGRRIGSVIRINNEKSAHFASLLN